MDIGKLTFFGFYLNGASGSRKYDYITIDTIKDVLENGNQILKTANNFSNYLLTVSSEILDRIGMPLDTIEPLMQETFSKAFLNGPENSQTGPGKRGDIETIKKHVEMLEAKQSCKRFLDRIPEFRYRSKNGLWR